MKNGYYLSTYLEINELGNLYHVSDRHDQNMSLWRVVNQQIELVHYWEMERVTGKKHHRHAFFDANQAKVVINKLLSNYNLLVDDMIEIWGTPGIETTSDYHSLEEYPDFSYHAMSHLFSAILLDSDKFYNDTIIGFSLDFGSDSVIDNDIKNKIQFLGGVVREGGFEAFPVYSPGLLWEAARRICGYEEGTLMALSSASQSVAYFEQVDLQNILNKGRIEILEYVRSLYNQVTSFTEDDKDILFNGYDSRFTIKENQISMVMKKVQELSIMIMDFNIDDVLTKYDINPTEAHIAMSGGFSLNCPTNSHIMTKYKFKDYIAPPCVSDSGQSLGIALYAFYKKMGNINYKMTHAYYGDQDQRLTEILQNEEFKSFIEKVSDFSAEQAVIDIQDSPIVWFNGASEIGPRALGNRSLLSDPRTLKAKDQLNQIKGRQWWRPVAPIVMEEELVEWFENAYTSPFMLHTFKINKNKETEIPGVAHLDRSARVQTMNQGTSNEQLYQVLQKFKDKTDVPIICNTSLNDKGEPIINKIEEALNFALRKEIKIIYINGKRIQLINHKVYNQVIPQKRYISLELDQAEHNNWKEKLNPYDVSFESIFVNVSLGLNLDLKSKANARYLNILSKKYFVREQIENISEVL